MNKVQKCGEKLKDPLLLANIVKEVQKEGVVGEEDVIMSLIMKIMLRHVINADKTSSNLVVSDKSGGGKDFLVKAVCKVMLPEKDYFHRTGLSEKVFTYWKSNQKDFTWNGKVIHLEDPDKDLSKSSGFRVMASGQTKNTIVKDQEAVDFKIRGKPVMLITSFNTDIDTEGIRRWDTIRMDISERLTELVIEDRMLRKAGIIKTIPDEDLREALQSLLIPHDVKIPFIKDILKVLPSVLAMRTIGGKFIDYIKASALLHQFQRDRNKDGSINADYSDYEYARFVFQKLIGMYGVPLNSTEENLMQVLIDANEPLSVKEIATQFDRSISWIYRNLTNEDKFKTTGLIKEMLEFDERSNKEILKYYTDLTMRQIPIPPAWLLGGFYHGITKPDYSEKKGLKNPVLSYFGNCISICNTIRINKGMPPIKDSFSYIYKKSNNTYKKEGGLSEEVGFVSGGGKPQKTVQNQKLSLFDKIKDLTTFIKRNKESGYPITHEMLLGKFDEQFITQCLDNGSILLEGEEYNVRYQHG